MKSDFLISIHSLIYLCHKGGFVSSQELADNICTTGPMVRKNMLRLIRTGFAESRNGVEGGYRILHPDATLKDLAKALNISFVSSDYMTGSMDKDCLIASNMGPFMDSLLQKLNQECIDRLSEYTISGINERLSKGAVK